MASSSSSSRNMKAPDDRYAEDELPDIEDMFDEFDLQALIARS